MKTYALFLGLVSTYVVYRVTQFVVTYLSNARKAKKLGCLPAPEFPSPDPLGIIPVMNIIKANDAGKLPEHIIERFEMSSKKEGRPVHTMHTQFLRIPLFNTKDPKIVQAILATQFKDFELGPIRLGTFGPL
jgi:hypothetical protein